jgi:alpha-beta hydrolase superfamily lysophospholipase
VALLLRPPYREGVRASEDRRPGGTVQTFLDTYVYKAADAVVLIAHSLGGLACRRLILDEIGRLKPMALS